MNTKLMKILLVFTYDLSLQEWYESGIIFREISLYKNLIEKNTKVFF